MKEPHWVSMRALVLLHGELLAEHGGLTGFRDVAALQSAMARPRNLFAYEREESDLACLAAAYAFGIIRNHPFADGNKRAGFMAAGLFLGLNGYSLVSDQLDSIRTITGVAAGDVGERVLAEWIRSHMVRRKT